MYKKDIINWVLFTDKTKRAIDDSMTRAAIKRRKHLMLRIPSEHNNTLLCIYSPKCKLVENMRDGFPADIVAWRIIIII